MKNAFRRGLFVYKSYQIFNKAETSVGDKIYPRYVNGQPWISNESFSLLNIFYSLL